MSSVYPDTSFLLSLYTPRASSDEAAETVSALRYPLTVTTLLLFEFENAARQGAWMNSKDKHKGFPIHIAQIALARMEADVDAGVLRIAPCDYGTVIESARRISNARTWQGGYRSLNLLHVATSRHLKIERFLSFDLAQRRLAESEGLQVGP